MLVYQDTRARTRRTPPPWLDGAIDLYQREDRTGASRWWGIGNAHLVGERADFIDLDDGWRVAIAGTFDPQGCRRTLRWCRTVDALDVHGRRWTAPVVLNENGDRIILVSYGRDYLPALTAAQERALAITAAARGQLLAAAEIEGEGLDLPVACAWTAELLSLTHHVSMEVLAALTLIDDALVLAVLSPAAGLTLKRVEV